MRGVMNLGCVLPPDQIKKKTKHGEHLERDADAPTETRRDAAACGQTGEHHAGQCVQLQANIHACTVLHVGISRSS